MVTGRLLLCVSLRLPRPDSALSNFCQTMLIFESTKTNTPIQQDLAPILIPPPHMYVHNMATTIAETSEDTSIFKQKPTRISCVKQSKINVTHLSKRNNTTSASDSSPSRSLNFSPPLESCSDIYAGPTSCLIITLLFNVLFLLIFSSFFICHFSLSVVDLLISILYTQIERSFCQDTPPYCWLAASVFWDFGQALRSKEFFKNRFVHV